MGFRFGKSFSIFKGLRVNVGKKGASVSIGGPGATVNVSSKGTRATVGLPGTGLSYTTTGSAKASGKNNNSTYVERTAPLTKQADHICPQCGVNTENDWRFCPYCTKKLM